MVSKHRPHQGSCNHVFLLVDWPGESPANIPYSRRIFFRNPGQGQSDDIRVPDPGNPMSQWGFPPHILQGGIRHYVMSFKYYLHENKDWVKKLQPEPHHLCRFCHMLQLGKSHLTGPHSHSAIRIEQHNPWVKYLNPFLDPFFDLGYAFDCING